MDFRISCFIYPVYISAEVAHLVEHDLAKVGVAGSSPVFRSANYPDSVRDFFSKIVSLGWWNW